VLEVKNNFYRSFPGMVVLDHDELAPYPIGVTKRFPSSIRIKINFFEFQIDFSQTLKGVLRHSA
jgi:hypothetical protein